MPFKLFFILALPLPFPHIHVVLTCSFSLVPRRHQRASVLVPCHLDLDLSNHTVLTIFCRNQSCFFVGQNSSDMGGAPRLIWAVFITPLLRRHPRYSVTTRSAPFI